MREKCSFLSSNGVIIMRLNKIVFSAVLPGQVQTRKGKGKSPMNNKKLKRLTISMAACLTALMMFASCGGDNTNSSSESSTPSSVNSEGVTVDDETGEVSVPSELEDVPTEDAPWVEQEEVSAPTGEEACSVHTASYHSIPLHFIMEVGSDEYNAWADGLASEEDENIAAFVQNFSISREDFESVVNSRLTEEALADAGMTEDEYRAAYGYTTEQIDAIYSGVQETIDAAFAAN